MEKVELIFIPHPGVGHLYSAIEFAKLLLEREDRLSVTFLVTKHAKGSTIVIPSETKVRFIQLPHAETPPSDLLSKSVEKYVSDFIASYRDHVKDAIVKEVLPGSTRIAGVVVDMFSTSMIDVANELGIPSYLFFASDAAFLAFTLYLPIWHDKVGREFEKSDPENIIPGFSNPVPTSCLPSFAFSKEGGYTAFVNHGRRFKETSGIIINTFQELQPHALSSLSAYDVPPIYTAGPLVNLNHPNNEESDRSEHEKIMKWLDDQPTSSVVFLCFGSYGRFEVSQLREIALGLEKSRHRFLWSMRVVSKEGKHQNEILPEGFQERAKDRGLVICGWTPQVEVLAHKAVGAFVSHCGWNSILESIWFGVPIVTLPLYAEQQLNAFEMVKELGLAIELKMDYRSESDGIVRAEEIERAVRCVMEAESEVRKKVSDMSEKSRKALKAGGSSFVSVGRLLDTMLASN